ncbi:sensor histidine kinase [Alkalibacter mobilis]|uniref:sensor histidine kinase n=1 Tax=Alkalibacter mobilis TaxID=2787712 RepID=UPI00189F543A|nr:HAMP domain-containing sensor histidine kinase [Alkalibacter mobilis]MBF7097508.1 HAMP domain-containing histidine kinase [Alkalibacter mobilis]
MSIRKLWMIVLMLIALVSVGINAFIFGSLTDKYFVDYLKISYDEHLDQIIDYTTAWLEEGNTGYRQMSSELETHLIDPIIRIQLYDPSGRELVDVSSDYHIRGMMMDDRMPRMRSTGEEEIDKYVIESDGSEIGTLVITRHSTADDSLVARLFKAALLKNSLFSIGIALIISAIAGIYISGSMSRDLKETALMASVIQGQGVIDDKKSFVNEISSIRESLKDLSVRLRLKQKSRKELTDQLLHETRTPLTILKSHLEAIEDGVIDADDSEIQLLKGQIENVTAIIANLSSMIDAESDINRPDISEIDLTQLLRQTMNGLRPLYKKKNINLILNAPEKMKIRTDRHKLSQIIYNLLTNSYKYTHDDGKVVVECRLESDKVIISVRDNGEGIDGEDLKNIFDAYYRGSADTQAGEGIGLFVVRENVKLLGGEVTVESEKNSGTIFEIALPFKQ